MTSLKRDTNPLFSSALDFLSDDMTHDDSSLSFSEAATACADSSATLTTLRQIAETH